MYIAAGECAALKLSQWNVYMHVQSSFNVFRVLVPGPPIPYKNPQMLRPLQ
jgi:hypothetical protein